MNKQMTRVAVKIVFWELLELLSQLARSEYAFEVPEGAPEKEYEVYVDNRLSNIRRSAAALFLEEPELERRVGRIVDETERFLLQCEIPGVVLRWKQIDPRLQYFDCAFDLMGEAPESYEEIRMGLTGLKLGCYPDADTKKRRDDYLAEKTRAYQERGLPCTEERLFWDELLEAMAKIFRADFPEYLSEGAT